MSSSKLISAKQVRQDAIALSVGIFAVVMVIAATGVMPVQIAFSELYFLCS